jgi:hypothetical protein
MTPAMTRNQDLNASIRDGLLSLILLGCESPAQTLAILKPELLRGDVLSVWEAIVDNQVVLKEGSHWTINPVQPDCPWSVDISHWIIPTSGSPAKK